MKNKQGNIVWNFFASVKLALFCLFTLAAASIIGTLIPQNETSAHYLELYGPKVTELFKALYLTNMYESWWFISLLVLFSINLTICTIERFPHLWKVVTQDNLATKIDRLQKMAMRRVFKTDGGIEQTRGTVRDIMTQAGWKPAERAVDNGSMFFSQKGAWTRLGVIIVHTSILVIFTGALIGKFYGFKASVMIPEGSFTDVVYESNSNHPPIPLGFHLICDAFHLTYYDNTGMPKEYRSDLTVQKDGKDVLSKSIVVNDPLKYGGLTFYQSSYRAMDGQFTASLMDENTKAKQKFILQYPTRQATKWPIEQVSFGITDISGPDMMQRYRYKIWFSDGKGAPSAFWMDQGSTVRIERPGKNYVLSLRSRYATGLQVAKDPGVWLVYLGCLMMIFGLTVIFFMSHRRVWAFVSEDEQGGSSILVSGASNKDKVGFEKHMHSLYERFEESKLLQGKNHE